MSNLMRLLSLPLAGLLVPGTALAAGFGLSPDAALPFAGLAGIALVTWRAERYRAPSPRNDVASSAGTDHSIRHA